MMNSIGTKSPPPKGGRVREGGHYKKAEGGQKENEAISPDKSPRCGADKSASTNARRLRREMTDAQRLLWRRIRGKQIDGYRFRKQVPLGHFIADFACMTPRLVIEIDGGQHAERTAHDDARTSWLESQGFVVLRFWNNEVSGNIDGVLLTIADTLRELGDG